MILRVCSAILLTTSFTFATFDFEIFPLSLEPSDGRDTRFAHESSGEVVSVEERTDFLKGGVQKTSKVQETRKLNKKNGTITTEKKVTEFYRYPNGTIRKVEYSDDDFSGDTMIDCIEDNDCNKTLYCDRLRFACKPRMDSGSKCESNKQCLEGLKCRQNKCTKALGINGESCTTDQDCEKDHCCAFRIGENVCSRRPALDESCDDEDFFFSPRFFGFGGGLTTSEKPTSCPCQNGLTCQRRRTLFFFETKTCQGPRKTKKAKKPRHFLKTLRESKRSVVDDMMGLVSTLLNSIKPKRPNTFESDNEIKET